MFFCPGLLAQEISDFLHLNAIFPDLCIAEVIPGSTVALSLLKDHGILPVTLIQVLMSLKIIFSDKYGWNKHTKIKTAYEIFYFSSSLQGLWKKILSYYKQSLKASYFPDVADKWQTNEFQVHNFYKSQKFLSSFPFSQLLSFFPPTLCISLISFSCMTPSDFCPACFSVSSLLSHHHQLLDDFFLFFSLFQSAALWFSYQAVLLL